MFCVTWTPAARGKFVEAPNILLGSFPFMSDFTWEGAVQEYSLYHVRVHNRNCTCHIQHLRAASSSPELRRAFRNKLRSPQVFEPRGIVGTPPPQIYTIQQWRLSPRPETIPRRFFCSFLCLKKRSEPVIATVKLQSPLVLMRLVWRSFSRGGVLPWCCECGIRLTSYSAP